MKNCRNCRHADWYEINGRRRFGNRAECKAPVDISVLPASAWEARRILEKTRVVATDRNEPVDCAGWEKIDKGEA